VSATIDATQMAIRKFANLRRIYMAAERSLEIALTVRKVLFPSGLVAVNASALLDLAR
jgi:hypothetical protein